MILILTTMEENILCASSLVFVCLICVFVHGLILIKMSKRAKAKSPFVLLCISRSFAHIMSSVAMTISMAVPLYVGHDMLIYGLNVVTPPEVSLYPSELFLAANRFVAVFFWSKYHKIFTFKVTIALIIISWILGTSVMGETLMRGCVLTFDSKNLQTAFSYDACWDEKLYGQIINLPGIFASLFLNLATMCRYLFFMAKMRNNVDSDSKGDGNFKLFIFAFAECMLWLTVQIMWWSEVTSQIQSRVGKFYSNTMFSNGGHIIEGLIFISCYQREMFPRQVRPTEVKSRATGSYAARSSQL